MSTCPRCGAGTTGPAPAEYRREEERSALPADVAGVRVRVGPRRVRRRIVGVLPASVGRAA